MSHHSYCDHCREGLGQPTPDEIIDGSRECPHCGRSNDVRESKDELLAAAATVALDPEPCVSVQAALDPPTAAAVRAERERTSDGLAICASRLRKARLVEAIGAASTVADLKAILGRVIAEL